MGKVNYKRVLGVVGSPRQGGNTDLMVDEILAGAADAGAEVEKVFLADLEIQPCRACFACRRKGKCAIKDDMADLLEKMKASGVWVLGTPVYWWGPSAQLKAFVDRWFAKGAGPECTATFAARRLVLAVPFGDTDRGTARHVVGMFRDAMDYVHGILFASILAPGAYDKGDVGEMSQVLEKARRTGHRAVSAR